MPSNHIIVVGVDADASSDEALAGALRGLAADATRLLHVVHVLDPRELRSLDGGLAYEREAELLAMAPTTLRERVHALAQQLGLSFRSEQVATHSLVGDPEEVLRQACVDYTADLLVVGTHGRTGEDRMINGSVAEALVRRAPCSVLVARSTSYEGLPRSSRPSPPYVR